MAKWIVLAVVVVVVVLGFFMLQSDDSPTTSPDDKSGTSQMTEQERAELEQRRQERRETEFARRQEREKQLAERRAQLEQQQDAAIEEQQNDIENFSIEEMEAARLYQLAETQFKIGGKLGMTYKQSVDACREILAKYPDTTYASKARELLRRIPQRYRTTYNITNEEMGL
jgi:hypothetical protein